MSFSFQRNIRVSLTMSLLLNRSSSDSQIVGCVFGGNAHNYMGYMQISRLTRHEKPPGAIKCMMIYWQSSVGRRRSNAEQRHDEQRAMPLRSISPSMLVSDSQLGWRERIPRHTQLFLKKYEDKCDLTVSYNVLYTH